MRKILNLRIFDDDDGKRWMKSVTDKQYEILCVSQVITVLRYFLNQIHVIDYYQKTSIQCDFQLSMLFNFFYCLK